MARVWHGSGTGLVQACRARDHALAADVRRAPVVMACPRTHAQKSARIQIDTVQALD